MIIIYLEDDFMFKDCQEIKLTFVDIVIFVVSKNRCLHLHDNVFYSSLTFKDGI